MAYENKQYWTEKRIAAFERSKEARMQGLKKAQQGTSGPPSPKKLAALHKTHASRRGKPLSEELIQKDREAMLHKYQEDPEFYAKVVENNRRINSTPDVQQKHRDNTSRNWQSPEYVRKHALATQHPDAKRRQIEGARRGQKKRWANATEEERRKNMEAAIVASRLARPSGLEKYIKALLDNYGIEYIFEHKIGRVHVDFYIPSHNLVLEVYGCYWHGCVKCGKPYEEKIQSDRKREYFIRSQGYNLYILWEHDLGRSEEILTKLLH